MRYTIEYEASQEYDSGYITIPIIEPIEQNEAIGDTIGIYKDGNMLEFSDFADVDDEEIRDFIKEHFYDPMSVLGFMRNILR